MNTAENRRLHIVSDSLESLGSEFLQLCGIGHAVLFLEHSSKGKGEGSDKNIPFDGLALDVCQKTKAAIVTGESAPKILAEIAKCPLYDRERVIVKHIDDFREAVLAAAEMAESGDIVLLSPACASFDHFKDFAERGRVFKKIVNKL